MTPVPRECFEVYLYHCAWVSEGVGLLFGNSYALSAALIAFLRQWKSVRIYLLIACCFYVIGFGGPPLMDWIQSATQSYSPTYSYVAECTIGMLLLVSAGFLVLVRLLFPVCIAIKRRRKRVNILWVVLITMLSFLSMPYTMPLWSIALFWAHRKEKVAPPNSRSE